MEQYWEKFMNSGAVEDYLQYKGMDICRPVMETYKGQAVKMGESESGSDNSDRNGAYSHSYRRI